MKKKSNDKPIKEAVNEMLSVLHLDKKYQQQKLVGSWEKIMGKSVSSRTSKVFFSDKKLFVFLDSAPLRAELFNSREKIKKLLNDEMGVELVEEVIFK